MRSLSATEKLMPSPWLPSRRVVSYISSSGFIQPANAGKELLRQIRLGCKSEKGTDATLLLTSTNGWDLRGAKKVQSLSLEPPITRMNTNWNFHDGSGTSTVPKQSKTMDSAAKV